MSILTLPNIGLIGKLRSGKDTVADYLEFHDEGEGYGYLRYAFGDGIRDICRRLYPDQFANGAKPRALLQQFGEYARTHDRDVWVNDMFRRIRNNEYSRYSPVVVSDIRQMHEVEALKARGYVLIRVEAPEALRIQRAITSGDRFNLRDLTHGTETALDDYAADFTVTNDAGLPELYAQIDEIVRQLSGSDAA
jgi:dephospho-CoA kinase